MLLIITEKIDLTSDYLIIKLIERNVPFVRFNTEEFFNNQLKIRFSNKSKSCELLCGSKRVELNEITGAYFRRPALPDINDIVSEEEQEFVDREIEATLAGVFRLINDDLWLNAPKNIFNANNKIEQLNVAQKIGFTIPNTLVSNDSQSISNFIQENKQVIGKAVKHGFYSHGNDVYLAFTKEIGQDYLENIQQYSHIPMILQTKIEKEYDIRINVIGNKVYATALLSQEFEISKTDWRVWDVCDKFDLGHEKIELPSEIIKMCLKINKHYHLNFSAIDMILSKSGEYYFLELNPNGQWAWIEEKVGYPLRDSIIDFFEEKKNEFY